MYLSACVRTTTNVHEFHGSIHTDDRIASACITGPATLCTFLVGQRNSTNAHRGKTGNTNSLNLNMHIKRNSNKYMHVFRLHLKQRLVVSIDGTSALYRLQTGQMICYAAYFHSRTVHIWSAMNVLS